MRWSPDQPSPSSSPRTSGADRWAGSDGPASERPPSGRQTAASARLERTASGRLAAAGSGRWERPLWTPTLDVLAFDDAGFAEQVLGHPQPVIVDFWAETCVPCRRQEPVLERLGVELRGRARVGRVNVYDNPRITEEFLVKGVPHLMVLVAGQVVLELVGDHTYEQLVSKLREVGLF